MHFTGLNHDTICGLDGQTPTHLNVTNVIKIVTCGACLAAVQEYPCHNHSVKFCAVCWTVLPSTRLAYNMATGGQE